MVQTYNVRLRPQEIEVIIKAFEAQFAPRDHLWLFGSRVDLAKRGGDIDLYVETGLEAEQAVKARVRFCGLINYELGEQKIDVVLNLLNTAQDIPIYKEARKTGVLLR